MLLMAVRFQWVREFHSQSEKNKKYYFGRLLCRDSGQYDRFAIRRTLCNCQFKSTRQGEGRPNGFQNMRGTDALVQPDCPNSQ